MQSRWSADSTNEPRLLDPTDATASSSDVFEGNTMLRTSNPAWQDGANTIDVGPTWVINALLSRWMQPLQLVTTGLKLKQVTMDALHYVKVGYPQHAVRKIIHSDGATSEGPAAWANIVFIEDHQGFILATRLQVR